MENALKSTWMPIQLVRIVEDEDILSKSTYKQYFSSRMTSDSFFKTPLGLHF